METLSNMSLGTCIFELGNFLLIFQSILMKIRKFEKSQCVCVYLGQQVDKRLQKTNPQIL